MDNGKAALAVRNLCDYLVDLNMCIVDNKNITGKHVGRKGLNLIIAGSICLAKNIIYKLREFWCSLEHLNESPARVSNFHENNIS